MDGLYMNPFHRYLSQEERLHTAVCQYPDLQHRSLFYFHPHNESKRSPYERYLAKVMRLRPGLPDLMLPLPQGGHAGLGIGLKVKRGKLTENQKQVGQSLRTLGWKVEVCYNFDQAQEVIDAYLTP